MEGYNAKVQQTANDLAVEAAEALKLPCAGGSDARGSLDEVGRGATFFKRPIAHPGAAGGGAAARASSGR